eukprot:8303-Eustigmatos_ZCMA.PRE.1
MSMLASGLRGVVSATRRLSGVGSVAMKPSCASAISHAVARPVALAGEAAPPDLGKRLTR